MTKKFLILIFLCVTSALHAANYLTFTAEEGGSSFGISEISIDKRNVNVQFSLDGGKSWEDLKIDTLIRLARKGDKALLRGNNPKGFSSASYSYTYFVMTGRIAASGSVMSLIDNEGEAMVIPNDMCFRELFMNCTSLIKAPALPAISLKKSCYKGMFNGCSNLTQAPELPADSLTEACYFCMFSGCTSLTKTPVLPATQLAESCYYSMFSECTKLTQAPELPATQLAEGCYQNMFSGCTKLTHAPALPATELREDCYTGMFYDCPNLKQYPQMPDLAMIDYYHFTMYHGSPQKAGEKGLTFIPSQIQHTNYLTFTAEEDSSSFGIYGEKNPYVQYSLDGGKTWYRLEKRHMILLPHKGDKAQLRGFNFEFSTSYDSYTKFVLSGSIAASGSVMSLLDGTGRCKKIPSNFCFRGLFEYCYKLTRAPELPATELTPGCYADMFMGCERLTEAPELPATILKRDCYRGMFHYCTNLAKAPELPATALAEYCYAYMFEYCDSLTQTPLLPATELSEGCYLEMFKECKNLSTVNVRFTDWGERHKKYTQQWLDNVAPTGKFICPRKLRKEFGEDRIPQGWKIGKN